MSAHADHEAYLRAVLHEAAESLEPRGDGLERIRARLRQPRPLPLAWAQAVSTELVMRTPTWLQDGGYRVADWFRLVFERFAPAQAPGRHRSRTQGLLRPLAAMAAVMFIVAVGTYVAISASTAIFPSSSSGQPGNPNAGGHSAGPGPAASHTSGTQSPLGSGSHSSPSPTCKPSSPAGSGTSPAAQQSPSASPSVNPSPTDSTTATSSPSPADSSTTSAAPPSAAASVPPANPPTGSPIPTPALTTPRC